MLSYHLLLYKDKEKPSLVYVNAISMFTFSQNIITSLSKFMKLNK